MIFPHLVQSASLIPTDASALESSISALETSISALEAQIRALDSRPIPWEHALPWFTFAVLVGVTMEWWVIRHDFREEMETWAIFDFIGLVRFPSRPSVRKQVVEITSVALIVFGIFGELGIGLEIASINSSLRAKNAELRSRNSELRSKSDRLLALVTKESGDAGKNAKAAELDASTAHSEVQEATRQTRETTKQLNDENKRRIQLEESLNPRLLPFNEFSDGTTNIDDLKPLNVNVAQFKFLPSDMESARAAANLSGLFGRAGWKVEEPISPLSSSELTVETLAEEGVTVEPYWQPTPASTAGDFSGVIASKDAQVRLSRVAENVVKWLRENGWEAHEGPPQHGKLGPPTILILVGMKPNPYFTNPRYKEIIAGVDKMKNIDPNKYKKKNVVHTCLTVGTYTVFCGPTKQTEGPN